MIIIRGIQERAASQLRDGTFTGDVWATPILPGVDDVTIAAITFTPGARTFWHRHERGQILHVLMGSGLICSDTQRPQRLEIGDTVWVPPGERHWHGASPHAMLSHLAVSLGATTWDQAVSDAEYVGA